MSEMGRGPPEWVDDEAVSFGDSAGMCRAIIKYSRLSDAAAAAHLSHSQARATRAGGGGGGRWRRNGSKGGGKGVVARMPEKWDPGDCIR